MSFLFALVKNDSNLLFQNIFVKRVSNTVISKTVISKMVNGYPKFNLESRF
jgi:hypothetical protein